VYFLNFLLSISERIFNYKGDSVRYFAGVAGNSLNALSYQ